MKANDDLVSLIKVRISEHQKAEEVKAEALREQIRKDELQRIASEQEADRLAAIKPEPVVAKAQEPVRALPVQVKQENAPAAQDVKPEHVTKIAVLQAQVDNFEALIQAVANGLAPTTLLTVNWEALDKMVAEQGSVFSMAGVTLVKVAA